MVDYPIAEKLHKNAAIHCVALAVTPNVITGSGWPQLAQPNAALRNGTLTFVKSGGRTYGITCQHVIQHYRDVLAASGNPGSHTMRTMLNGFYVVMDCFVFPHAQFGNSVPDIAIREISPAMKEAPEDMRHAYAVGFPEKLKYHRYDNQPGYRVSLPQVEILAELQARPHWRFTMFSELQKPAPDINYSGMSGGPIFWSTENEYGILGIIYAGGPGEDNERIYVYGEIATPNVIKSWIAQCPPLRGDSKAV